MIGRAEIVVIGAGMAGASLAAEVAPHASVLLLEAESHPGYHATGRSAAFWAETYGGPLVQPLTTASRAFLAQPPRDFHDRSFLAPRGALSIGRDQSIPALEAMRAAFAVQGVELEWMDRAAIERLIPLLKPEWTSGLLEPSCSDIDVAALHGAYVRAATRAGATLVVDAAVNAIRRDGSGWRLETARGRVDASIIVNAAGAWADDVAEMAGLARIGIRPLRRTMAQLRTDPPVPPRLPLVLDIEGGFYFKPEAGGRLWLSPQDETPSPACDCAPDAYDVALAIDRLEKVVEWKIEKVEHSWAGLRSFAPDRLPVYGFSDRDPGFFWFAGQGGFGIQSAPAAAKLAASLLLRRPRDPTVAGVDPTPYSAARFAN